MMNIVLDAISVKLYVLMTIHIYLYSIYTGMSTYNFTDIVCVIEIVGFQLLHAPKLT